MLETIESWTWGNLVFRGKRGAVGRPGHHSNSCKSLKSGYGDSGAGPPAGMSVS